MSVKDRTVLNGKVAIIDIRGSFVADTDTKKLKEVVADYIEQGVKCLIVNLYRVNYINSAGIGALISAHALYGKNGGDVKLAGIRNDVLNLLVVTKLIDVFDVYDTVDEAINSFANVKSIS